MLFFSRFFPTMAASGAAKSKVRSIIENNAVAVFSKSYCPYCQDAKRILADAGVQPYIIELNQVDDGADIQRALLEMTGQNTVPRIYIGQQHIGGSSDLKSLQRNGKLSEALKAAGAL